MEKHGYLIDLNEYNELSKRSNVKENLTSTVAFFALIVAGIAFITLSILCPFSMIDVVAGICMLNIIFDNFFAERLFGNKFKKIVDVYCVSFMLLTMPIQWFGTGGFGGVGALWSIFTLVYCFYGINGFTKIIFAIAQTVEMTVLVIVNYLHPEYVSNLEDSKRCIIVYASMVGVGGFIQCILLIQDMEFMKDKEKLETLQEDITAHYEESVAMNDELINTTEKLEMAIKTQKSFTASMNHELRSPLNGIEGCLQILYMDESLSDDLRETVKNALTASKTINETVNDLLDFSKLEEGKFEIIKKAFDLRDILDNITTIFNPQASAKNIDFIIKIPKETRVNLVADSTRIQQVIANLVSNGIKYTSKGSVLLSIETERGLLKFDVKDTGQGMSEENIKVLFDPFTRFNLEDNVKIQGTGLGMNIVSNLIKEMKGKIEVESKLGLGTKFHVEIPILFYDSEIIYTSPRLKDDNNYSRLDLSAIKVLCVDDTEINRTVFKGLLKKTGAYIVMAESGSSAISLCEEQSFDIIFLDHQMPNMDGIETYKSIRNIDRPYCKDVPIVMFTGNAREEDKKLYADIGAAGHLTKPIMYEELIDCFRKNCENLI